MKKFTKIAVNREDEARQLNLLSHDVKPTSDWFPPVYRDKENFGRILYDCLVRHYDYLGIDFEFPTSGPRKYIPTIIGISTLDECAAIYVNREEAVNWLLEIIRVARLHNIRLVGHSVIGAEIPVILETCGIKMGIEEFDDSLLRHFLINQDFAKQASKKEDDDRGALGFMNLWTTASMVLDIPAYKQCRGKYCDQLICPKHDPRGYCAADSWCSIAANKQHIVAFKEWALPERVYEDLREITGIAEEMTQAGIKVDMAWVNKLEAEADKLKEGLFPLQEDGSQIPFNPRSGDQVLKYFNDNKIHLESNEKKSIEKALAKIADKMGLEDFRDLETVEDLPEPVENLYKAYQYKDSGKGLAPWFGEKYRDKDNFIHPRGITVGASTTRWSMSRPNCFDMDTEILTRNGWKTYEKINENDNFAQWDQETGNINFVPANFIFSKNYTGKMVYIENQHISLGLTEDHRCPLKNRKNNKWTDVKAIEYNSDKIQPNAGIYSGGSGIFNLNCEEIKFLVAVQADGSWDRKAITFSFKRKRKIKRILKILENLNIKYSLNASNNNIYRFYIPNCEVVDKVFKYLTKAKIFDSWILNFSREQLNIFIEEIFYWDGEFNRKSCWASKDKISSDWVGIALAISNKRIKYRTYTSSRGSISNQIDVSKKNYSMTTNVSKITNHVEDKKVWCLSVPSSYVIIRRNNRVQIIGQCQNIPARGFGSLVRAAIVPRNENLTIVSADESQLELRMVLYLSGVDPEIIGDDAFNWLVENSNGAFDRAAELAGDSPRGIAKTVSHAGSLMEGFSLLSGNDLMLPRTKKLIEVGALKPYLKKYGAPFNWEFCGKVVAFTGANLADRVFGDKSWENRKKALDVQEIYFTKFPMIRDWQRKTLAFVEAHNYIRYPTGNFLRLNGRDEDNAKIACAALMQGTSAQYMCQLVLKLKRDTGRIPLLFVHDDITCEVDRSMSDKKVDELYRFMGAEVPILPGFRGKYKVIRGDCWLKGEKDKKGNITTPPELIERAMWPLKT